MPVAVAGTVLGSGLLMAGVIVLTNHPQWWPAFGAATMVALLNAAASMAVLRRASGKTLDSAVAVVYMVVGVRLFVSVAGCLLAVKVGKYSPEATGIMICSYYMAMLVAESIVLARAVAASSIKTVEKQ
jgi:hypothetical protein